MKKIIYLLQAYFFILLSCNDNSTNPSETKEIWPLKVGNYWVWKFTNYDSVGNIKFEFVDTVTVYKDSLYGTEKIYAMKSLGTHIIFEYDFAFNRIDGFYGISIENNDIDSYLIFKYPGKVGDWFVQNSDSITIISTNELYQSTAGKFICYKYAKYYNYEKTFSKLESYFSPGIGQIGVEYLIKRNDGTYYLFHKTELISYFVQ